MTKTHRFFPTIALGALLAGCGGLPADRGVEIETAAIRIGDPPAASGSFAPGLRVHDQEVLLTWWEPVEAPEGERRQRLLFSRFDGSWSEPSVVAEGREFFANWADTPSVNRAPDGALVAHWLAKQGEQTYAYGVQLARSEDNGQSWQRLGRLKLRIPKLRQRVVFVS